MARFPEILKQLRLKHGLTQTALANELHVTQNAVFNWENAKREPGLDMLQKIADYFKVSATYLLENEESYYRFFGDLYEIANGKISQTAKPLSPDGAPRETISETEASPAEFSVRDENGLPLMTMEFEKNSNFHARMAAYAKLLQKQREWYESTCAPLNEEGQRKVAEYAATLSEAARYQKPPNEPA
ncbi:helix-turn-helix domain-containing protein [Acetatifactor aquisgranensis]|uniref:helix-turn-helix domain-containing protein n=1 Tax=Acetatifactor aquisgranensis TaxID=2941233 RepID=UPI00203ED578|nr:helix-turn-helix transcriptional regulator [Acetatifactor aquisgranensis]MCI8544510.1 helix-turn-helix transcriptional regulator [Lachnospiraceae bacterium]